jgi:hypothetical protein
MKQRDRWVIVLAMLALSLDSAASQGCGRMTVFVGDAETIEAELVERSEERDDRQESGDPWPEEPITDVLSEISEIDEVDSEDEAIGCNVGPFEETAWSKVYATNDNTDPWLSYSVRETFDGSYVVAGDSDESLHGWRDAWVLKLDRCGNVIWEGEYGKTVGVGPDISYLALTRDLGYVVGSKSSMMKLAAGGNVSWSKSYRHQGQGVEDYNYIAVIKEIQGGGFAACGTIWEMFIRDIYSIGYLIMRIDEGGQVVWSKKFYDHSADYYSADYSCSSMEQMPNGDLIVAGDAWMWDDDNSDVYVQRLSADGTVSWKRRYRRDTEDEAVGLHLAPDGGYVLAANAYSHGESGWDAWFMKLDADGGLLLQETIGGEMSDRLFAMATVGDDGYILCGETFSFGAGEDDAWLVRLDSGGNVLWQKSYGGAQDDNCLDVQPTTDGGFIVTGFTDSFGANNLWVMKLDANGNISDSCPPGLGVDTAAVVQETFAEAEVIFITMLDWDLIVEDLDITPAESTSAVETQCAR